MLSTSKNTLWHLPWHFALAAAILVITPQVTKAQKTTKEACEEIAGQVAKALSNRKVNSLNVMAFDGIAAGPQIQTTIRQLMAEKHDIDTKDDTGYALRGLCRAFADDSLKYNITATLLDQNFNPVDEFYIGNAKGEEKSSSINVTVDSRSDVVKATGTNVDNTKELQSGGSRGEAESKINKKIVESYKDQNSGGTASTDVHIDSKYGVSPSRDSFYSVKLLVKKRGKFVEKDAYEHKGKPFVDFDFGDVMGIRIYNNSDEIVVVDASIDGISVFEFSEIHAFRELQLFSISPGGHLDIVGWHKTNREVYEFLVSDVENSQAAKLKRDRNNVGVVSVLFYPAWDSPSKEPKYLLTKKGGGQNAGVDKGDLADDNKKERALYFDKNSLLASVAIRYDVIVDHKDAELPLK